MSSLNYIFLIALIALFFPSSLVYAQPSNQDFNPVLTVNEKKELMEKEKKLKKYIMENPLVAEAHLNLGNVYWKQERAGKPIRHYMAAIKLKPDFAEAYYNLGNVFFREGEFEQAVRAYKKGIELNPLFADAYNGLGNAYVDKGDYLKAIENYQKVLDLNPKHSKALHNLCTTFIYSTQYEKAISLCQQAIDNSPDARAYNNLGNAYFRSKQFEEALESYKKALSLDAELSEAHFNIAAINLVYSKNKVEAIKRKNILQVLDPQKSYKLSKLIQQSGIK